MFRCAMAIAIVSGSGFAFAEDEKPIKADVVLATDGKKAADAKAGDTVEFQIPFLVDGPSVTDFSVTVDDKKVKHEERITPVKSKGGYVLPTVKNRSLYITAEGSGTQKIVVEYTKGKMKSTSVFNLKVK